MWLEILKIIAPSALTAIALGYFFNKKLEKHKMFLKVNELFLTSLINGLHLLLNDYKAVVVKVEGIKRQILNGVISDQAISELRDLRLQYEGTLRGHRIYLAALIPYGGTQSQFHTYDDVNLGGVDLMLQMLRRMQKENDPAKRKNYEPELLRVIDYVDISYRSVCNRANEIIEHIQSGRNPFAIRWERLESPAEWDEMAEEMHGKNQFYDLDEDVDVDERTINA